MRYNCSELNNRGSMLRQINKQRALSFTCLGLLFYLVGSKAFANFARISRGGFALPANDLVYNGEILRPEQARRLLSQGVDLSNLDPAEYERGMWENNLGLPYNPELDQKEVDSGDTVSFQGVIKSAPGEFRFSVITSDRRIVTLYADKKLHTTLLRKNYLRKLGYIVPAIKWLKNVSVNFKSTDEKDYFIENMRRKAEGTTKRWIDDERSSGLTLYLRDVAAVEISDTDLYNPAFGVPPGALGSRVLRSLIVPYALLDLKESVNKFSYSVGREENSDRIILPHFFSNNNFGTTTFADAQWMAKRMSKLSRADIEEVVKNSYFPAPVAKLVTEKLVSRTNTLMRLLEIPYREMKFDSNVSEMPHLLNGKILKIQWRDYGYASEFAAGDATSPFKDFNYYIYSMLQSIGIDSVVSQANEALKLFDPNDARIKLAEKEFNQGLEHFVKTGEFMQFPVSTWYSPVVNGNLILSRDVVVGNYLGTENLVQLADTFGYAFTLGGIMGVENVDVLDQVTLSATGSYVKTFTHLKPLTSLKDVFKEEYRNLAVMLLKKDLSNYLQQAVSQNEMRNEEEDPEEKNKFLGEVVENLNNVLDVGESLIITEKVVPKLTAGAVIPLATSGFVVGLKAGAEYIGVKRLQILRRDAKTIQVYDDNGYGVGADFTITLQNKIPIVRFEYRVLNGQYNVNSFLVNIDADDAKNPNFMSGIQGLHSLITTSSSEVLNELAEEGKSQSASKLHATYQDRYSRFAFLFWRSQSNKGFSRYDVSSTNGLSGNYVTHHDVSRSGLNWESFVKDIVKYGMSKVSGGDDIIWRNDAWADPSTTFFGSADVLEANYEGQVIDDKIAKEYMSFAIRYEGWSRNQYDLGKTVEKLNKNFGKTLFTEAQIEDIKKLFMYDISAKVNIYERGIARLKSLTRNDMIALAANADADRRCSYRFAEHYTWVDPDGKDVSVSTCGALKTAIRKIKYCDKEDKSIKDSTECWLKVAKDLFKDVSFDTFEKLLGENNYFLEGEVNGFRKNDEILNEPITSNNFGRRHPKYPYGMINVVQKRAGIQNGEFTGQWLRERP